MTRILATSDLHGYLPEIPECDILIVAGDVCPDSSVPDQRYWLREHFRRWLQRVPARYIVGIAGNHDFVFQKAETHSLNLPWIYLQDAAVEIEGLKFYGLPWVPNLIRWAFYATKEELAQRYNKVPKDTDIVISHGPPWGYGDFSEMGHMHVGARQANNMLERVKPKAYVCGHIHEAAGYYDYQPQHGNEIGIWNVAYVDIMYRPRPFNPIVEIDLSDDVNSDAKQDETDGLSTLRHSATDTRPSSEPIEGSKPSLLAMAGEENSQPDPVDS